MYRFTTSNSDLYVWPSGLKDYGSATLRCKIWSLPVLGLRPHALHPGAIQGKEGIKFCHLATLKVTATLTASAMVTSFAGLTTALGVMGTTAVKSYPPLQLLPQQQQQQQWLQVSIMQKGLFAWDLAMDIEWYFFCHVCCIPSRVCHQFRAHFCHKTQILTEGSSLP